MQKIINDILNVLANNATVLGVCSAITIIGFLVTIYISIKTKNIGRRINEIKTTYNYNNRREGFRKSFIEFRNVIVSEDAEITKIKGDILDELNALNENYRSEFKIVHRIRIYFLIVHLEKSARHNSNYICNELSKICGYLFQKKENVV